MTSNLKRSEHRTQEIVAVLKLTHINKCRNEVSLPKLGHKIYDVSKNIKMKLVD